MTPLVAKRPKRRRKRSRLVAERTLTEIRQKKRAFLKDVSMTLSDVLGFQVRVALVAPNRLAGMSPDMRRGARMTKKQARDQMRSAFAPFDEPQ